MPNRPINSLFNPEFDQSNQKAPELLVSVRSVHEALEALAGGADIIDIKEPANGPLGAASVETIQAIAEVVSKQSPNTPVTVALGELTLSDFGSSTTTQINALAKIPAIVAIKVGLAGMKDQPWINRLAQLKDLLATQEPQPLELVPVAYADDEAANSPTAEQVFAATNRIGLRGFLIDTYTKNEDQGKPNGGLFGVISQDRLSELFEVALLMEITAAIAGSLTIDQIQPAMLCKPAIIGLRGAVCEGGREGVVSQHKVREMRDKINELAISQHQID